MSLVTLEEVKTFLGIDDADYNEELEALIIDAEALLNSILEVPTLELGEYTELSKYNLLYRTIRVENSPVKQVLELAGQPYTGELNRDYIIKGTKITFVTNPNIQLELGQVLVKYKAGFNTAEGEESDVPNNIKLAVKYLASGLWNTKKEIGVTSVKVGEESYSFANYTDQVDFLKIIKEYKSSCSNGLIRVL